MRRVCDIVVKLPLLHPDVCPRKSDCDNEVDSDSRDASTSRGAKSHLPASSSKHNMQASKPQVKVQFPLVRSTRSYADEIPSLSRHFQGGNSVVSVEKPKPISYAPRNHTSQLTLMSPFQSDGNCSFKMNNFCQKNQRNEVQTPYPSDPFPAVRRPYSSQMHASDRRPLKSCSIVVDKVNKPPKIHRGRDPLACGPRANRENNNPQKVPEKGHSIDCPPMGNYNKSDFNIEYALAKFFMIKSFSEDNIHKSIKYNVWASTKPGNDKLEQAFHDAQAIRKETGTKCPIFLFFSVNASGQFVGLAEMIGPVDFKKTMDFWQLNRWCGFFPLQWHVIKDIPNRLFLDIRLENNENKEVTFSKDTQEIGLPQGLKMLQIFKSHVHNTSILDDYDFYENMEKSNHKVSSSSHHPRRDHVNDYNSARNCRIREPAEGRRTKF